MCPPYACEQLALILFHRSNFLKIKSQWSVIFQLFNPKVFSILTEFQIRHSPHLFFLQLQLPVLYAYPPKMGRQMLPANATLSLPKSLKGTFD